jgi:prefoldin beta subunit
MSEEDCCNETDCKCGNGHKSSDSNNPFANLDQKTQEEIQELQILEQSFQQLLMQKNAFNMERNETELVISEVKKSNDEVFRIIGNSVMIKSSKEKILEDMKRKQELIEKRLGDIEKQESDFSSKIESIRENVLKKIQGLEE